MGQFLKMSCTMCPKMLGGSELWKHQRKKLVEIINFTSSINNVEIQIEEDIDRFIKLLLSPKYKEKII
jgi:hypothetical protein